MDDYPGQNQMPGTPPPPSYQAPPPAYQPPVTPPAAPPQGYAPQQEYAPPAAPPKKKTWLWIVIAVVVLGLLGCCAAIALGGLALFSAASEPADSIEAINQAALDGDTAAFEKYFDIDEVSANAYVAFIEYVKQTPDFADVVTELGEEEADRLLREEIMPEDAFVAEISAQFSIDSLEEGDVPFPEYTISSTSIDEDTAEITVVTVEDGEDVTYVLGMVKEQVGDEAVWRITEILNIEEMLADEVEAVE